MWWWKPRPPRPLGRRGEDAAARFLKKQGYRILDRNRFLGKYEIDIIARDGNCIAFVEVKSGRNLGPNVEVTSSGLTPDLQIVVNPNAMLRAGDAVDLAPRTAAK